MYLALYAAHSCHQLRCMAEFLIVEGLILLRGSRQFTIILINHETSLPHCVGCFEGERAHLLEIFRPPHLCPLVSLHVHLFQCCLPDEFLLRLCPIETRRLYHPVLKISYLGFQSIMVCSNSSVKWADLSTNVARSWFELGWWTAISWFVQLSSPSPKPFVPKPPGPIPNPVKPSSKAQ